MGKMKIRVIGEMCVKGKKENPVGYIGKRSFKSNEGQLCNWTWECRRRLTAHKLTLLKSFVSRN